jgi:hypothetical protein
MSASAFGHLAQHFSFVCIEIKQHSPYFEQIQQAYPDSYSNYTYATAFIEIATAKALTIWCLTNEKMEVDGAFAYYLQQLPSFELENVAMLFALLLGSETRLQPTMFSFPAEYPSYFGRQFLQATHGKVLYHHQFINLFSCCLPSHLCSYEQLNHYRQQFNLRTAAIHAILEPLYLPDGYPLSQLLQQYNPICKADNGYGFTIHPRYAVAFDFMQAAKQYLP